MRVETSTGSWLVPAHCAVWVPHSVEHSEQLYAGVSVRTLYFKRNLTRSLAKSCRMVNVSALLRELILKVSRIGVLDRRVPSQARLASVLLDELGTLTETPLQLPLPRDSRALRFAALIEQLPSEDASVAQLARRVGASRRTLERLFLAETKMSVGEWRRRLRLLHAVRLLASGRAVTEVALEAGYSSVSAFIAVFRKKFGTTPSRYSTIAPVDRRPPSTDARRRNRTDAG
jgi:AraC-like DNA-binding protein